jgi:hypothetical protein
MTVRERSAALFLRLPVGLRARVLHRSGRFGPWEQGFDFTPPGLAPGEHAGPPDFVGIGVQKAGTTWWFDLVTCHPSIFSRSDIHKERHFFDRFGTAPFGPDDVDRYHGWFPRRAGTVTGEWTPDYFHYPWTPELLRRAAPDTRLLLLLRDPIERLRSGLAHQRRTGVPADTMSLSDAVQRGFYDQGLRRWTEAFDPDRMLVLQYERCALEPASELRRTFRFLGLDDEVPVAVPPRTPSGPGEGPPTDRDVVRRLVALYEDDVVALARRCPQIDLTLWPNFAYLVDAGSAGESSSPTVRP